MLLFNRNNKTEKFIKFKVVKKLRKMVEENQREEKRKFQLGVLESSLKNLFVANQGRNVSQYGEAGKQVTHDYNYIPSIASKDEHVSQLVANQILQSEKEEGEMYAGGFSSLKLLKNAEAFYVSGINQIKVGDLLDLIDKYEELGDRSEFKRIAKEDLDKYMEDFKEENEDMYKLLTSSYLDSVVNKGIGEAYSNRVKAGIKNLGDYLRSEDQEENSE